LPLLRGTPAGSAPDYTAYEKRRRALLEYCSAAHLGESYGAFQAQIATLELGRPADPKHFPFALAFMKKRGDCSDFVVGGLVRILYRFGQGHQLPAPLRESIETALLEFKYWWDEPGVDLRSYDTENHQMIYHSDQLLAGQLFPDRVFTNSGRTGREQVAFALPMVRRWLDWRARFGFSEWLSNSYFEEDLMSLTNLRDFAEQEDIRARAEMLIDVILFEIALHSYRGTFGSTHGRAYAGPIKDGAHEGTATISYLMFGSAPLNKATNLGALALATSGYRCPPVIAGVAGDVDRTMLIRERCSLNVEDAAKFGLSTTSEDDLMLFRGIQDFTNYLDVAEKLTLRNHLRNPKRYTLWREIYAKQIATSGRITEPWLSPTAMGEVHIQTLRTPHFMLSCAQDYRPGTPGFQQHIWQATLAVKAVVFTTHPGDLGEGDKTRPNFWTGNGIKPRAVQHHNVLVCLHRVPASDKFPYSHAYFPVEVFDEVVERGNWTFARQGEGYLALYCQHPGSWNAALSSTRNEWRSSSPDTIWLCEMSSRSESGPWAKFMAAILAAPVRCDESGVRYGSPSIGEVCFSWSGPLRVAGAEVPIHNYPRFDNPYCQAPFLSRQLEISRGADRLTLDFDSNRRT